MARVLQDWAEVGEAVRILRADDLPGHPVPEKNWDLALLRTVADSIPRSSRVADFGCAGLHGVELLESLGFEHILGLDLSLPWQHRLRSMRRRRRGAGYDLRKADITSTGLADGSLDLVSCLSVIEHGVDVDRFASEVARVLRPGGTLLLTTDYWPEGRAVEGRSHFGLAWRIFDRESLAVLIETFARAGLHSSEPKIDEAGEPVVLWSGLEYTFAAVTFTRA